MRFLIVDDSKAVQAIIRRVLYKMNLDELEIQTADEGLEALRIIDRWLPDMVLTDWHMPTMNGIELLKALRGRGLSNLRVGFITTESALIRADEAKELGAAFFLNKPFTDEELMEHVSAALSAVAKNLLSAPVVEVARNATLAAISNKLFQGRIKVKFHKDLASDLIYLPSAVALFAHQTSGEIRGMTMADVPAVVLMVGAAAGVQYPEIGKVMAAEQLPANIWAYYEQNLREKGANAFTVSDGSKLKPLKIQYVKQNEAQLREIIRRFPYRSDYSLQLENLPSGRLCFLAK